MTAGASTPPGRSGDTIFAFATGASHSALAVLRLSGPSSAAIVKAVAGGLPPPRRATLATFRDPGAGEAIDRGLVIFFEGPRSYTGEDCAEFHIHGGRAVAAALIAAVAATPGARAAEAGEFSRRALLNGKLDLAQVEGVADLVAAETAWQRRQALRQAEGLLGAHAERWRARLLESAALIEADIDFSDEPDIPGDPAARIAPIVAAMLGDLEATLAQARCGERIREGLTIVIAGPPNAGKSTLLNALARRDVAIVSTHAGTTRDALEVDLDLAGYALRLIDTAGLRETVDPVEKIGIARTLEAAQKADLILWLEDVGAMGSAPAAMGDAEIWRVANKADRPQDEAELALEALAISAATGRNLDLLLDRLTDFAARMGGSGREGLITRERHRKAVADAVEALRPILDAPALPVELIADHLRAALFALERLCGRVGVEDILDEIFSRFCIGK